MQAAGIVELNAAEGGDTDQPQTDILGNALGGNRQIVGDMKSVPRIDRAAALGRIKAAGLEGQVKLADRQEEFAEPSITIMLDRARERAEYEATIRRAGDGALQTATRYATSFLVGAIDPLNLATSFIPIMGELRYAKLLASAGGGAASRAGVRAGVGAAQGVVGQALLEPLDWWAHTQEGRDFGMADVMHNLAFGAILGGVLHSGGGAIADLFRARAGKVAYPFGPGDPLYSERSAHVSAESRSEIGVFPNGSSEAVTPVEILRDLPPAVRGDATQAAIASIVDGSPVRVGEMLAHAARAEPRIAESFGVWSDAPYRVSIKSADERVIDLQKSFHEQSDFVKTALSDQILSAETSSRLPHEFLPQLAAKHATSADALDHLQAVGIEGVKHSEVPGSQPHYVIFDRQKIDIVDRNGQAVPVSPKSTMADNPKLVLPGEPVGARPSGPDQVGSLSVDGAVREPDINLATEQPRPPSRSAAPSEVGQSWTLNAALRDGFESLSRIQDDSDAIGSAIVGGADGYSTLAHPLEKRLAAARAAEDDSKQLYDMFRETLSDQQHRSTEDLISQIDHAAASRADALKRAGSCIFRKPTYAP